MKSLNHVPLAQEPVSVLRKVLKFNTTLGITLPKDFCNILELDSSSYVRISYKKPNEIILQKLNERHKEIGAKSV